MTHCGLINSSTPDGLLPQLRSYYFPVLRGPYYKKTTAQTHDLRKSIYNCIFREGTDVLSRPKYVAPAAAPIGSNLVSGLRRHALRHAIKTCTAWQSACLSRSRSSGTQVCVRRSDCMSLCMSGRLRHAARHAVKTRTLEGGVQRSDCMS
jgi:hypothetical protein